MRNFIMASTLILAFTLSIFTSSAVMGRQVRDNEIRTALGTAMENAITVMTIKPVYDVNTTNEFVAEFLQNLIMQIDSDSTLTVKIIDMDVVNGMLDVEVTEEFLYPNGKVGKVSVRKTIIVEYN